MNYIFFIQGEGFGHSTQSIALRSILERNGHSVSEIYLGKGLFRKRNPLYRDIPHKSFLSPEFIKNRERKGIALLLSFVYNLALSPLYLLTIMFLIIRIRISSADRIVVFYDLVAQLAVFLSFSRKPSYSVSHHFFFLHPAFPVPEGKRTGKFLLNAHSFLASLGADRRIALSFTREKDLVDRKLFIVPPLLRKEITSFAPSTGDHIHIYSLQAGFLNEIIQLAVRYPGEKFQVFLHSVSGNEKIPGNMTVAKPSGEEFALSLRTCKMLISTAGFETPAEAAYLNKPVIMIPSRNHYEQFCNAVDAVRAGIAEKSLDFSQVKIEKGKDNAGNPAIISWINSAEEKILKCMI